MTLESYEYRREYRTAYLKARRRMNPCYGPHWLLGESVPERALPRRAA